MLITCPICGFSRDTPADRVPRHNVRVTCPRCNHRFPLYPAGNDASWLKPEKDVPMVPAFPNIKREAENTPKAGFWIRAVAALLDSAVVTVMQLVLAFLFIYILGLGDRITHRDIKELLAGLTWAYSTLTGIAYYVFFTGYCGQTPGKMILRVKVVRTTGAEIGFGKAILRETIGKFISGIVFCLGYFWVAFDQQKQGWHDKIAGTYVIKLL